MKKYQFLLIYLFFLPMANGQLSENLALTPPMGWNSWNKFGCDVSEQLIKEMADALVETGMKSVGYEYIVIDDCWQVGRDSTGNILADPERFPSGMESLANYLHERGLKFGIYSCAGSKTCQGRPGSRGYQFQDAQQYARWGVDYLKYDWCYNEEQDAKAAYKTMRDALNASGRPIVFSICEWGESKPWEWASGIGHLWRTTPDIRNYYDAELNWGGLGIVNIIDKQVDLWPYAGPGHWNDPDMLEVGNSGLTQDENITHFSMWAMLSAPLMAGNDIREMSPEIQSILTHKQVIAINQDSLGLQAIKFLDMGDHEIWVKFLENDNLAVCFLNRAESPWEESYNWQRQNIYHKDKTVQFTKSEFLVYDVWANKNLNTTVTNTALSIPPHGVLMVKLIKK